MVEGLPKIPPAVKDYAAQVGQIPAYDKDTGLYVYFDNQLRLPVPDMLLYRVGAPCRPFPCWLGWGELPIGRAGGDKEVVPAGRKVELGGSDTIK